MMNPSDNANNNSQDNITHIKCPSTNFDSACHFDNYSDVKQPAFEGWFDDDKLVKVKVDGKIIDFSEKTSMFNIIDRAVGKLVDFKYKFS